MYDQMRNEQMSNDLNQSKTWIESDQNQFSLESKEIRRKKDPRQTDELPAGLQRVLQSMVKQSVECSIAERGHSREQSGIDSLPNP